MAETSFVKVLRYFAMKRYLNNSGKKLLLTLAGVGFFIGVSWGQVTIASEDFENTLTTFSVTTGTASYYSGNTAVGDLPASSPFAVLNTYSLGKSNATLGITSNAINTTGYSSVNLTLRLTSFSIGGATNGADAGDIVTVEISPDGGATYYSTARVLGFSNACWAYSTGTGNASTAYDGNSTPVDFAPVGGGNRTTDGYSTITISGLPAVASLTVRITLLNNSTSERWCIDDFKITGILASCTAPTITAQPTSSTKCVGESVTFSVTATCASGALNYQWRKGGTNISGATSSTYTIPSVAVGDAANYDVVVTCVCGSNPTTTSSAATLTVNSLPANPSGTITPGANPACTSTTLTYSSPNAAIYWQTSATGTSTASPTTSAYTVTTSGTYYARAYNGTCWSSGAVASAAITINPTPTISGTTTVNVGANTTLTGSPGGGTWSSGSTGVATISAGGVVTGVSVGTSVITYTLSGCIATTTVTVSTGPCYSEDFVSFTDWTNSGTAADNLHCAPNDECRALGTGTYIISPFVDYPTQLKFQQDASSGGSGSTATVDYKIGAGGAWTSCTSFTVSTTESYITVNLTNVGGVDLSAYSEVYFRFNSTFNTWYLDDVEFLCGSCAIPLLQASAISFSSVTDVSMILSWTIGDGDKRIVKMNTSNSFTSPVNGTDPTANSVYGGSGEQVVYNNSGSSVSISGLSPATTYWYRVYEYNCSGTNTVYITSVAASNPNSQATISCVAPTTQASSITFSSVSDNSMAINWTNGNGSKRVVKINTSNSFTNPANGTDPTANSVYGGSGEQVVYNNSGNSVSVTGLSPSTTYWFRVYEYNCTGTNTVYNVNTATNNPNSQVTTAVSVAAVLVPGDLIVMGVNSNIAACVGGSAGDDEISFVCFKDITPNTFLDLTDEGWERCHTGQWGNSEGFLRIQRTTSTIPAGTVITIRLNQTGAALTGIYPDNNWTIITDIRSVIMNSNGDQLYFMQGGTWNDGLHTCNPTGFNSGTGTDDCEDATYTGGTYLFGFNTNDDWLAGVCDVVNDVSGNGRSQNSGMLVGMDCFTMTPNVAKDFLKYTGPTDPCSQIEWVGRVNDPSNWTNYTDCSGYYAGAPNYTTGQTISITEAGIDAAYNWYGHKSTEWFDCANWGTLRVPIWSTNVVIPNDTEVENNIVLIAGETAECKDFTISNASYSIKGENGATKVLNIYRHLVINAGTIDFDDGNNATADGTINVASTWTNNSTTNSFLRGNSTVNFTGTATHTITSSSGIENFHNISVASPGIVSPGVNDLLVSGTWTNYSSAGFTEGTGLVTFDGSALQTISTPGGETFYDLEIKNSANVSLGANVTVTNDLYLNTGNLVINGVSLTLQKSLSRNTGYFTGSSTSDLIINGTGNLATPLWFSAGGEFLDILNINRASSGIVTMGTNLTVSGQLAVVSGILSINDKHLTISGTTSGTGTVSGSALSELTIGGSGAMGTIYFTSGSDQVRNLTVNRASGTATLGTDLTVNNLLTLTNGIITTGIYKLIVSNSSATSVSGYNTNSYINGNLRRYIATNTATYGLPVGSLTRYTLAELVNGNLAGVTYLDAKFLETFGNTGSLNTAIAIDYGTPYSTICTEGIWQIDPDAGPSAGDYDIKLWFNDGGGASPFSGIVDGQFGPLKRNSSSTLASDWAGESTGSLNAPGTPGTTLAGGYAQRNNITSFSHHAIGISAFLLPIELISFNAVFEGGNVELTWSTSSEQNNDYFTIERSSDGFLFDELKRIAGAGTSFTRIDYSDTDYNPHTGTSYYRLKQTDFDGKFSYSEIVAVNAANENILNVYADNNTNTIHVVSNDNLQLIRMSICDVTGRTIYSNLLHGTTEINLDEISITTGIYFINISDSGSYLTKKIFIP